MNAMTVVLDPSAHSFVVALFYFDYGALTQVKFQGFLLLGKREEP